MKIPVTNPQRLLKKSEVASLLGISARSVDRMLAKGDLKRVRVLGSCRFRLSDVERIIQEGTK